MNPLNLLLSIGVNIEVGYVNLTGDEFREQEVAGLAEVGVFQTESITELYHRTNFFIKTIQERFGWYKY